MPCVDAAHLVRKAAEEGYAVPAFDVETCEMAEGVVRASQDARSPMILQIPPQTLHALGWDWFSRHVRDLCEAATVPVALHLDHALQADDALRALEYGFTSVMYDGSALAPEDNLRITRRVAEAAHAKGVSVEGEIGHVGRDGEPAHLEHLTTVDEAETFARGTGVDLLAVAVGTRHGHSPGPGGIDIERLDAIRKAVKVPLVLHGGSGVGPALLSEAVRHGIAKVNIGTALSRAYLSVVAEPAATPGEVAQRILRTTSETARPLFDVLGSRERA